jgi:hypothetical protein
MLGGGRDGRARNATGIGRDGERVDWCVRDLFHAVEPIYLEGFVG